jgi:hypothetical protein
MSKDEIASTPTESRHDSGYHSYGEEWYTSFAHIRTFLTVHGAKNTLYQLKIILDGDSWGHGL